MRDISEREKDLRQVVRQSFKSAVVDLVLEAHDCAAERFDEDFVENVRVADILLSQQADPVVIAGAFLAPLRQCDCIKINEIRSRFGETLATLVEKVFSENVLRTDTEAHREADLQRFLKSISGDLRAVILRVGLRLAELERLVDQGGGEHQDMAQETLDLYVPLADWMGLGALRTRLEDVCFQILQPAIYDELARSIDATRLEDEACLELLTDGVKRLLEQKGINGTIHSRKKGLYSLYHKMCRLDAYPRDVLDRLGLRIIVSSVEACYAVLGLLHIHFRPVPGAFDDYIGLPKANGYQSLHTCVYPVPDVSRKPVEFQIRTQAMHREAEYGIAAHWLYKSDAETQAHHDRQLQWLQGLLSQREEATNHDEFIERLRQQVFGDGRGMNDAHVIFAENPRP